MKINIKNIRIKSICATLFISIFLSCNSGVIEELEKKNSFFDSLVKIGHGFQDIFGSFGDALGFNAVKSTDNRSKVGEHFEKVGKGLQSTKEKLDELAKQIVSIPHADIKGVEAMISTSSEVITKLIASVGKLAEVTKKGGATEIGKVNSSTANKGATPADVQVVIEGVKEIIEIAKNSGLKVNEGNAGTGVTGDGAKAPAALVGKNGAKADANAGPSLADEVAKADPWAAMINKIKDATTNGFGGNNNNNAGQLAIGNNNDNAGSKTNADLAAGVALKAMTQGGEFSATASTEEGAVKGAAVSSVNKVLGVLNDIFIKVLNLELSKIKDAVNKIQYSETTGEATEGKN
ncbi:variable large family protein (plasmid) [Borrelia coriaceae]|uniref:Variable large protein n=1 Tax=Borrelia coriaceae ATCC 43381 TaxID=1408429 RepID=W5SXW4_9SPIR|nr:variable large family protein [Borrelia coriaceae]AHH11543.1 Variable major protein [Borrelia coriaceae ATCC 43381]UPA17157.1 variable large family protein [Borrelia coriaceae]